VDTGWTQDAARSVYLNRFWHIPTDNQLDQFFFSTTPWINYFAQKKDIQKKNKTEKKGENRTGLMPKVPKEEKKEERKEEMIEEKEEKIDSDTEEEEESEDEEDELDEEEEAKAKEREKELQEEKDKVGDDEKTKEERKIRNLEKRKERKLIEKERKQRMKAKEERKILREARREVRRKNKTNKKQERLRRERKRANFAAFRAFTEQKDNPRYYLKLIKQRFPKMRSELELGEKEKEKEDELAIQDMEQQQEQQQGNTQEQLCEWIVRPREQPTKDHKGSPNHPGFKIKSLWCSPYGPFCLTSETSIERTIVAEGSSLDPNNEETADLDMDGKVEVEERAAIIKKLIEDEEKYTRLPERATYSVNFWTISQQSMAPTPIGRHYRPVPHVFFPSQQLRTYLQQLNLLSLNESFVVAVSSELSAADEASTEIYCTWRWSNTNNSARLSSAGLTQRLSERWQMGTLTGSGDTNKSKKSGKGKTAVIHYGTHVEGDNEDDWKLPPSDYGARGEELMVNEDASNSFKPADMDSDSPKLAARTLAKPPVYKAKDTSHTSLLSSSDTNSKDRNSNLDAFSDTVKHHDDQLQKREKGEKNQRDHLLCWWLF